MVCIDKFDIQCSNADKRDGLKDCGRQGIKMNVGTHLLQVQFINSWIVAPPLMVAAGCWRQQAASCIVNVREKSLEIVDFQNQQYGKWKDRCGT